MPDYTTSKIYCIKSKSCDTIYIGSTTQPLTSRLSEHKYNYREWFNGKRTWCSSYLILSFEDASIELLENYPCKTIHELHRKEGQLIQTAENCINSQIAGRTSQEYDSQWRKNNRAKCVAYSTKYREKNKEKVAEYMKTYHAKKKLL